MARYGTTLPQPISPRHPLAPYSKHGSSRRGRRRPKRGLLEYLRAHTGCHRAVGYHCQLEFQQNFMWISFTIATQPQRPQRPQRPHRYRRCAESGDTRSRGGCPLREVGVGIDRDFQPEGASYYGPGTPARLLRAKVRNASHVRRCRVDPATPMIRLITFAASRWRGPRFMIA